MANNNDRDEDDRGKIDFCCCEWPSVAVETNATGGQLTDWILSSSSNVRDTKRREEKAFSLCCNRLGGSSSSSGLVRGLRVPNESTLAALRHCKQRASLTQRVLALLPKFKSASRVAENSNWPRSNSSRRDQNRLSKRVHLTQYLLERSCTTQGQRSGHPARRPIDHSN